MTASKQSQVGTVENGSKLLMMGKEDA